MSINIKKLRDELTSPFELLSTTDGLQLFLRIWPTQNTSKSICALLFHGITAHTGLYDPITLPLSKLLPVYGLDLRGHGYSDGKRGDIPDSNQIYEDLEIVINHLRQKYERIILIGHSLGSSVIGLILRNVECRKDIAGITIISAGKYFRPGSLKQPSWPKKILIGILSIINPGARMINYNREGLEVIDDPLMNYNYSIRFIRTFFKATPPTFKLSKILYIIGNQDELFSIESAKDLYDQLDAEKKEFLVLKNTKHAEFHPIEITRAIKEFEIMFLK
ncbi:MAG: alpha/beta fold hydrolase [Candidatus Hodarchaeales archaeon]|jgi:alpha-beta hydrolase superfamily lysophospholipase